MTNEVTVDTARPKRTHPLGLIPGMVRVIGKSVFPMIAALVGTGVYREQGPWLFLAVFAVLIVSLFITWMGWKNRSYTIGAEDIRVESGVLARAARSIPYERIQDVSLEQKPIARLLGLVEVRFETGAGGKDELTLAYVTAGEGERLRELVKERREGTAPVRTMAEASAQFGEPAPIFAMTPARIFTFGLFEFSLAVFAVLLGAAQQFDFLLPFDPWDWKRWASLAGTGGERIGHWGMIAQFVLAIFGMFGLAILGFATGEFRTFAREFGFRLDRTARGFRRRRGLFTVTDVVMPAHRVQAVEIGTKFLRYRFGWHSLTFVSLAQDAKSASHTVAPFAHMEEIWPIAREAGVEPPSPDAEWIRPSAKAWLDGALLSLIPFGIASFAAALVSPEPLFGLLPLLAIPLVAAGHWFGWRRQAHALDSRQIMLRRGMFSPQLTIAERRKLQSVEIMQGPLGRLRGYATVHFGLAGGSFAIEKLDLSEARKLSDAVLDSITRVTFTQVQREAAEEGAAALSFEGQ